MKIQILIPVATISLVAMLVAPPRLTAQEKKSELPTTPAIVSGQSNAEPGHSVAIVQGRVTDGQTGAVIAGAIVRWRRHHRSVQGTTDVRGAFAFAIPTVEDEDKDLDDFDRERRDRDDIDRDRADGDRDRDNDEHGDEGRVSVQANLYRRPAQDM